MTSYNFKPGDVVRPTNVIGGIALWETPDHHEWVINGLMPKHRILVIAVLKADALCLVNDAIGFINIDLLEHVP